MLILVKHKRLASFPYLLRLVLRFIYEQNKMSLDEIHLMQESIINYPKKADLDEDELYILQRLAWMLRRNEEGKYERRKKLFREWQIDWRKFHKLPEAYDLNSLLEVRRMKEEYDRENPDSA